MLVVETIARIRRAHFVQGRTIKAISRELGIARNTIRRILRSGETSFAYQRDVQPRPKLGQWTEELDRRLIANDRLSRRERLGLIRIFEDLRGAGYQGGYDAVRRYDQARRRKQGQFMGYTESGQSRANQGIPRFACNPDLNHAQSPLESDSVPAAFHLAADSNGFIRDQ